MNGPARVDRAFLYLHFTPSCRRCRRRRSTTRGEEGDPGGGGEEAVADEVHARAADHGGGQGQAEAGGDE